MSDAVASAPKAAPVATRLSVEAAKPASPVRKRWASNHIAKGAIAWLAPWTTHNYPGRIRLIATALGRSVTYRSAGNWQEGRRTMPAWAAKAMAAAIRTRCQAGLAIADELDRHAAAMAASAAHKPGGWQIVGADGKDKRGNWKR